MPSNRRRILLALVALVAIQAGAIALYRAVERDRAGERSPAFRVERLTLPTPAPDIGLERANGTRTTVRAIEGKLLLVHFWATWCPPCVEELPGLLEAARELADDGLTLVAISMDEDWQAVRAFFGGAVPPEVYRAVDSEAHERYDVYSLPDSYLVSSDGQLEIRYGGARDWRSHAARDHLRRQLR